MNKALEALIRIEGLLNMLYETDVIDNDHTHDINIIGKKLKKLEELEKAFKVLSKDDEKAKELLSLEIEKNRALEIIKKELMLEVKEDNGLYRLITYQSDNHLLRKDQYDILKEILGEKTAIKSQ